MGEQRPPNVLFLMSDEHRADVTGYEGNPVVRTPALDWLAEGGVVFRHAYCPSPICVPGRQSMMAGQLPRTCRCEAFGRDLPPFSMTFARRLAQFGYTACCCGKLHHLGGDQMQGWTHRPFGDCELAGWAIEGKDEGHVALAEAEPGTGKWSNQKEVERAGVARGWYQRFDEFATDVACDFIDRYFVHPFYDRPGRHRPLLLKHSLIQPHYPFFTDERRFRYYMNRVPLFIDEPRFDHPKLRRSQNMAEVVASPRDIRRATAAYYGMVEQIDEHYGTVLDRLRHVGEDLDDWIIIYTSDHGEMLGEHGVWEKTQFFEGSVRVPLIIRWPRRFEPRVVNENVNLCDLFATLCELCGVPLPEADATVHGAGLDSRSLVPLMQGETGPWHERYHDETVSQFGGTNLMVKRGELKYQWYGSEDCRNRPEVLFDLKRDPNEREDLLHDARYADDLVAFRQRRDMLGFGPEAEREYRNAGYGCCS